MLSGARIRLCTEKTVAHTRMADDDRRSIIVRHLNSRPFELKARLHLRLLIVAKHLDALGGALVPATGLDIVLGDIEVHAICVNTGNGALGDVVLVWEDQ